MKQLNSDSSRGSTGLRWSQNNPDFSPGRKSTSIFGLFRRSKPAFHRFGQAHARPAVKDSFYNFPIGTRPNLLAGSIIVGASILAAVAAQATEFSPQWPGVGPLTDSDKLTPQDCIEKCLYNPDPHLVLDGNLNDWLPLGRFYPSDAYDAPGEKNVMDLLDAWMAHDTHSIYLAYTSNGKIDLNSSQNVYFDTDWDQHTGYRIGAIGANYLLQGDRFYYYNGNGHDFTWEFMGRVDAAAYGCQVEMKFPRHWFPHIDKLRFIMQADNSVYGGDIVDYFPDKAHYPAKHGGEFFCYRLATDKVILNTAPVTYSDAFETLENTPVEIPIRLHDADNDPLYLGITRDPANGSISFKSEYVLVYTPEHGFTGSDSFDFFITDGLKKSTTETITIKVHPKHIPGPGGHYPLISNPVHGGIKINGWLNEWEHFDYFGVDPDDADDEKNRLDWRRTFMAHSAHTLYLAYVNGSDIGDHDFNWAYNCFLDTDADPHTGFRGGAGEYAIGADYLIQSRFVFRYTGHGTDWSWEFVGIAIAGLNGAHVELALPLNWIGNPGEMHVIFVGMNTAYPHGYQDDYFPDDAISARTCFRYDAGHPVPPMPTAVPTTLADENAPAEPVHYVHQTATIFLSEPQALSPILDEAFARQEITLELSWTATEGSLVDIQLSSDLASWTTLQQFETIGGNIGLIATEAQELNEVFFRTVQSGRNQEPASSQ